MKLESIARKVRHAVFSKPHFKSNDLKIGHNVRFGRNVEFNCRRVRIGDGVIFGDDVVVNASVFEIGDFGTIYRDCFFPGPGELRIGHNFWSGTGALIDSQGGTKIGNNVGVGPHSQLWGHMKFGDMAYGCRFHSTKPLTIEDDAWLVGHCLVSPVHIGERSMAMLGSVITRDMEADRTYAGTPAEDITEKVGAQFAPSSIDERKAYLENRLSAFAEREGLRPDNIAEIVVSEEEYTKTNGNVTVFNVCDRTYIKRCTSMERQLIRFLLPDAKFVPKINT